MEDLHENASDMDIMLLQILKTTPGKKKCKKKTKKAITFLALSLLIEIIKKMQFITLEVGILL